MYKIVAIALISFHFLFELFLDVLSYRGRHRGVPKELSDVYDEERYRTWQRYSAEKLRLRMIQHALSYGLILGLLLGDVFALCANQIENPYGAGAVVLAVFLGANLLLDVPFAYVDSIVIEGKYGFNKSSIGTFVADQIKELLLSATLFFGLTFLFQALFGAMGDYILLLFTAILFAFILLGSFLYPLLARLFNRFTSLEEGELRTALIHMLEKHHYHVRDIKVMDASRRTTKSNAYFAGYGKTKTIVLYDNMLQSMTNEEILAIFAHEMGHGLHKDTLRNSATSLLQIFLIVVLAWLLVRFPEIHKDFGFGDVNVGFAAILLIQAALPIVSLFLGLGSSYLSRRAEYRADEQAVIEGYGEDLISGLKKLYRDDLGDLNPHPLFVVLRYSHPTLLQRVKHIQEFMKTHR